VPKEAKITQERVEYNVFLLDEPLKGSKSLKIFKISLTFRFDKLSNLSKSVHTGENSQILTVSNKNNYLLKFSIVDYSFKDLRPSTVYGLHNLKIYLFLLLFLLKHESRNFINLRYP
jgi:hypothetical protein